MRIEELIPKAVSDFRYEDKYRIVGLDSNGARSTCYKIISPVRILIENSRESADSRGGRRF